MHVCLFVRIIWLSADRSLEHLFSTMYVFRQIIWHLEIKSWSILWWQKLYLSGLKYILIFFIGEQKLRSIVRCVASVLVTFTATHSLRLPSGFYFFGNRNPLVCHGHVSMPRTCFSTEHNRCPTFIGVIGGWGDGPSPPQWTVAPPPLWVYLYAPAPFHIPE